MVGTCPHQWGCWDVLWLFSITKPLELSLFCICASCHGRSVPEGPLFWWKWQDFMRKLTTWFSKFETKVIKVSKLIMLHEIHEWFTTFVLKKQHDIISTWHILSYLKCFLELNCTFLTVAHSSMSVTLNSLLVGYCIQYPSRCAPVSPVRLDTQTL